jgi:hypothetical protein
VDQWHTRPRAAVPPVFDQARVHTLFTDTGGDGRSPILITGIVAVIGTGVRNTLCPPDPRDYSYFLPTSPERGRVI